MNVKICDLCGKPIDSFSGSTYKIKKANEFVLGGWKRADVHNECVRTLFEIIEENKKKKEK